MTVQYLIMYKLYSSVTNALSYQDKSVKINPGLAELRLSWQNLYTLNFKLRHATESGTLLYDHSTMNIDCGLHINPIWNPILDHPSLQETTNPLSSPDCP